MSPCNMDSLTSNVSEDVATKSAKKLSSSTTSLSFDAPQELHEYPHMPYHSGNLSHWATFLLLLVSVHLHSFSWYCLLNMWISQKFCDKLHL